MRRLAESTGVDLSSVKGSGPGGRLVDADVLGAATPVVAEPVVTTAVAPIPVVSGAVTVLLEIDVTHLRSVPDPDTALLAAVAAKAIPALRHSGAVSTAAGPDLEVNGQVIPRGGDLTVRALRQRIAQPAGSSAGSSAAAQSVQGARVTVHGTPTPAASVQIPALAPDCVCAVGVGGVRQGPVVIADGVHGPVLAVGALATIAVSYDPAALPPATATTYISTLSQRLADRALARELSD
jgi:pyruvate/2-oxoglutarate dehydrogenase complex dihydrolipoamide acyltransferase (E2) component